MRQAVRVIVIKDGALLVMHRNKFGEQYYTLIGGGIDEGESREEALHREVREETGLQVANPRLVYVEDPKNEYGSQHIYLCDYVSGEVALDPSSEEAATNQHGKNMHTPMWLPLEQLPTVKFLSPGLQQRIIQGLQSGWPAEPEHFMHRQV